MVLSSLMYTKCPAFLTVDLEDYRRQELRDHLGMDQPPSPQEVERQLHQLLDLFEELHVSATFFTVGRLTRELSSSVWKRLREQHPIGCHSYEHLRVDQQGYSAFRHDVLRAKEVLEEAAGKQVLSYRAPYFSADRCDPWFGEGLVEAGFCYDSSRRLLHLAASQHGTLPLEGTNGLVTEIPLPCLGFGSKRMTIIGGTYFRLMPWEWIHKLLGRAVVSGFIPMVYLHPYDLDATAPPLNYPSFSHWLPKIGDKIRRIRRAESQEKLRKLSTLYHFQPIESLSCTS